MHIKPVESFDFILFGARGDLAKKKIFPSLYKRMLAQEIPEGTQIIGVGREAVEQQAFQALIQKALEENLKQEEYAVDQVEAFLRCLTYVSLSDFEQLSQGKNPLLKLERVRLFYLSVPPSTYASCCSLLKNHHLITEKARIIVEKPFGHDLQSAKALNQKLKEHFDESQIYRIDHYLGKETVQNLMVLRFANAYFEPLWNAQHIDHVQITVSESIGVEGRGGYYDQAGAMRDMIQNHLIQLLSLVAMEPPAKRNADAIRDEKVKVIKSLEPLEITDIIRGQYRASKAHPSYREDVGNSSSLTESFVALKARVENWRWKGIPFYLRTGKRLKHRVSEISIVFKNRSTITYPEQHLRRGNRLIIRVQPDEAIKMMTVIKDPEFSNTRLKEIAIDMSFKDFVEGHLPDAYERLILDVVRGKQTLFMRADEAEASWEWVDQIIEKWQQINMVPYEYEIGGQGPREADELLFQQGHSWEEINE